MLRLPSEAKKMRRYTQVISQTLRFLTITTIPLALIMYILRGVGLLSFLYGWVVVLVIWLGIVSLIFFLVDRTYY